MTYEEIADKYIRESYIDYGDLNEKAEQQIKEAVIFGLKQGESSEFDEIGESSEAPFLLDFPLFI